MSGTTRYVLKHKKTGDFYKYAYPYYKLVKDIYEAKLFKSEITALLSANNKFDLSIDNGKQDFDVVPVSVIILGDY